MSRTAGELTLRSYAFIDRMQPQFAALMGTVVKGDVCVAGMAELFIETAPGSSALSMLNVALKATDVRPGFQIVEREYGQIEFHAFSVDAVKGAGEAVLQHFGMQASDAMRPRVVSADIIDKVNPYQAQLINRTRYGSLLVPGESLFTMEVEPAAYIVVAVNEAEKHSGIKVVNFDPVGQYGRLYLSGNASEVKSAMEVAVQAIEHLAR